METKIEKAVRSYIKKFGFDHDTNNDLLQEAEIAVFRANRERAKCYCLAYLTKTAKGAIRHYLRDKNNIIRIPGHLHDKKIAQDYFVELVSFDSVPNVKEKIIDNNQEFTEDILDKIECSERRDEILGLLYRLNKSEREIILYFMNGLSTQEIADMRSVKNKTIYMQKSRAIRKLKKLVVDKQ